MVINKSHRIRISEHKLDMNEYRKFYSELMFPLHQLIGMNPHIYYIKTRLGIEQLVRYI